MVIAYVAAATAAGSARGNRIAERGGAHPGRFACLIGIIIFPAFAVAMAEEMAP